MPETIDELAEYIRETLPQPKSIVNLRPMAQSGTVCFQWNGREFVVNAALQALEIKRNQLYITGASMLMQQALVKRSANEKALGVIVDSLRQAEEMFNNPLNREKGLSLLGSVKSTLKRLMAR